MLTNAGVSHERDASLDHNSVPHWEEPLGPSIATNHWPQGRGWMDGPTISGRTQGSQLPLRVQGIPQCGSASPGMPQFPSGRTNFLLSHPGIRRSSDTFVYLRHSG